MAPPTQDPRATRQPQTAVPPIKSMKDIRPAVMPTLPNKVLPLPTGTGRTNPPVPSTPAQVVGARPAAMPTIKAPANRLPTPPVPGRPAAMQSAVAKASLDRLQPLEQEALLLALRRQETGDRASLTGDRGKAKGAYQVWNVAKQDTDYAKTFSHDDMYDPNKAALVVRAYLKRYSRGLPDNAGRAELVQHMGRVWNGGPRGPNKPATAQYGKNLEAEYLKAYTELRGEQAKNVRNRMAAAGATPANPGPVGRAPAVPLPVAARSAAVAPATESELTEPGWLGKLQQLLRNNRSPRVAVSRSGRPAPTGFRSAGPTRP